MQEQVSLQQQEAWKRYLNSKTKTEKTTDSPRIAYAGTSGSFSEDATIAFFGEDCKRKAVPKFEEIFKQVMDGTYDYGVIPIENSSTGSVSDVLEFMLKYDCYIVGEQTVKIDQCLLALPEAKLEDITDVYSHSQSLMQCSVFLDEHPELDQHPYVNNALAAEFVSNSGDIHKSAIASERAAKIHGLKVLEEKINFLEHNTTRFIIIAAHPDSSNGNDKISISFAVGHTPGALVRVLNILDKHHLNMSKIESRPNHIKNWEYNFFVDIEGELNEKELDRAIQEVIFEAREFSFLGSYRSNIS